MKLSKQSVQVLEKLHDGEATTVSDFEEQGFDQAMVNRAALELQEKGIIVIEEEEELEQVLTSKGEEVLEDGSPEFRLLEEIGEGSKKMAGLQHLNLDVALGKARKKGWARIDDGEVYITEEAEKVEEDEVRKRLEKGNYTEEDDERGLVETQVRTERALYLTEEGKELDINDVEDYFDVEARVNTPRTGKKHFYREIMDYAREVWLEMGFEEISGGFVVPGLMNFDALYTPQDHPARGLHDTFFVENPKKTDLSAYSDIKDAIRETHENGWTTGSDGWQYEWEEEEASRNVLRTHTTAISAEKLRQLSRDDLPIKVFTLGRNFRNETVDRFHLPEFYQTDGIVVGEDLSFKNLKGYISKFFEKMGYDQFRLIPSYYPYTEMGVEVQVYDEKEDVWIGLGGAGMFRPEVVKPLLGFEATVLAWGLGIPRIAMRSAGLEDIRELYRNDIELLENTSVWRPDN